MGIGDPKVPTDLLLAEVEELIRIAPASGKDVARSTPENLSWIGRACALIERWDVTKTVLLVHVKSELHMPNVLIAEGGLRKMLALLHQARADLRLTTGQVSVAVGKGMRFEYFDEIRKIAEGARKDIFYIDPYLDAEFVSHYLPHSPKPVQIRLLAREKLSSLLPAAELFSQQEGVTISVRSAPGFHDRYMIVDGTALYQSGASFKDGGKASPTTLTQIIDAFAAVQQTYEALWASAKVEL